METTKIVEEDVVIVGAGIAGLTTALGLHRYPPFHFYSLNVILIFKLTSIYSDAYIFNINDRRLGVRSLVLECSDSLRVTGFGLAIWENAWKALDAVGVGDIIRHKHIHLYGYIFFNFLFLPF
jgi:2-polyprenyl-6-methoxyphenol hydroxylase-like FAD-dependent oxidoreductase